MAIATFPAASGAPTTAEISAAIPFTRMSYVTTTSTWTHPDGYSVPRPVKIVAINGGGGGQSGQAQVNTTNSTGQESAFGGGSSFILVHDTFTTSNLSITIGAGGTGGSAPTITSVTTSSVVGGAGGSGGTTTVIGSSVNISASNIQIVQMAFSTNTYTGNGGTGVTNYGLSAGGYGQTGNQTAITGAGQSRGYVGEGNISDNFANKKSLLFSIDPTGNSAPYNAALSAFLHQGLAWAGGGGGIGGNHQNGAVKVPGTGGAGAMNSNSGGTGGAATVNTNANATGVAGSAGGLPGGGGGGGGAGCVLSVSATAKTAVGGAGGVGGAGAVIIWY